MVLKTSTEFRAGTIVPQAKAFGRHENGSLRNRVGKASLYAANQCLQFSFRKRLNRGCVKGHAHCESPHGFEFVRVTLRVNWSPQTTFLFENFNAAICDESAWSSLLISYRPQVCHSVPGW